MPTRARQPCAQPACPTTAVPGGTFCPDHTPQPWETSGRRTRIRSSGWEQQRAAARIIRRHRGICHVCGQPGADEVDHVTPTAEGGPDTDDNKRPIHSVPCHRAKTQAEAARGRKRRG